MYLGKREWFYMEEVALQARDGYVLNVHVFKANEEKAVIQLIHGMEEHQGRYEKFIHFLNAHGFSVVSSDMRGHGEKAPYLGYFKEKNGYRELIEDQRIITDYIKEQFPSTAIYLFAHSMGTIITRVLLEEHSSNYKKVVLSGYPNYQKGAYLGVFFATLIRFVHGGKYKSKWLASLSIDSFNKKIEDPKTNCDWVCKREETILEYQRDPYCGFGFTCSAFCDLYHLVILMHKSKLYKNVNKNLKILLLRGLEDPCVGGEKGAKDSYQVLKKAGFRKIKKIDYPNMRHEILNERENKKVYEDVLTFYKV